MASTHKHIRSSTANKRPTTAIADGQIALNTNSSSPGLFFKDSTGATIIKVGPVHIGATAPNATPPSGGSSGNSTGEIWLDTSLTPNGVKIWDGSAWVNATPIGSTTVQGLLELATSAETQTGSDTARAVTPAGLQSKVSDSTSTTSSTTIASSTAVKAAYDLAAAAVPLSGGTVTGNLEIGSTGSLSFEGSTADAFETTIAVTDPTADRTITLPDTTGTVVTTGDTGTVTSTMIADGTIVNGDINASAAIAHTKLANITAGSVLMGNASNVPTATALSGDVTIDSSGVTAISSGVIVNADVNASAAIAGTKISPDFGSQNTTTTGTSTAASFIPTSSTAPANGMYLSAANTLAFNTNTAASPRLVIDSSGRLLVGTSSAINTPNSSNTNTYSALEIAGGSDTGNCSASISAFSTITGRQAELIFAKSADNAVGSHTVVAEDTDLGEISFAGSDGTKFVPAASILSEVDGAVGSDIMPGRLVFSTTASGAASPTERFRVDRSGRLLVGTSTAAGDAKLQIQGDTTSSTTRGLLSLLVGSSSPADGTGLGRINFTDSAGAVGASLIAARDGGTWSASSAPSRLVFGTSSDGSISPTERLRIDSSGRLLVGTSTSVSSWSAPAFEIFGNTTQAANLAIGRNDTNITVGNGIGQVSFWGNDSSGTYEECARIEVEADGTHGDGDKPSRLIFATTAAGAGSPTSRVQISSNGELRLLAGCPGINFADIQTNAAGMTSETLDSYEEGTWTVNFYDASTGGNVSSTTPTGYYIKVGNLCTMTFAVTNISTSGLTAANVFYYSLPFTSKSSVNNYGVISADTLTFTSGFVGSAIGGGVARGIMIRTSTAVVDTNIIVSNISTGVTDLRITITYQTA